VPVLRHYTMTAREDQVQALRTALTELAHMVRPLEGCLGIELFADLDKPVTFVFVEHWQSRDHQAAGGKLLGQEAFAPMAACLALPTVGRYLEGGTIA
jgi:quinol monooxygenase YgiN